MKTNFKYKANNFINWKELLFQINYKNMYSIRMIIVLCITTLLSVSLYSQNDLSLLDNPYVIKLSKEGKLKKEISKQGYDIFTITSLKLVGNLNAEDFRTINEMSQLKYLDLSEIRIIPGRKKYTSLKYYEGGKSRKKNLKILEHDILYDNIFYGLKNIVAIVLPSDVKEIKAEAFPKTGNYDVYFTNKPPLLQSLKCFDKCNKIIVPNLYFEDYLYLGVSIGYKNKLLKDSAPDSFKICLNEVNIESCLRGAYPYVKHLILKGNITRYDILEMQKCSNLESIDLSEATLKDFDNLGKWGEMLADRLVKSDSLQILEKRFTLLRDSINTLFKRKQIIIEEKKKLEEEEKHKQEQRNANQFLYALIGLADETVDEDYKNNKMSSNKYISNKLFNGLLSSVVKEELQKDSVSTVAGENFNEILDSITNKISLIRTEFNSTIDRKEKMTKEFNKKKEEEYSKIHNNSSIPNNLFRHFTKIKNITLPNNTIVISENALPGNAIINYVPENVIISDNIYY